MPTTITGVAANGSSHGNPVAVSGPASGDGINSGPIDTYLQAVLDVLALFQAQGARLDLANTFAGPAQFNAAVGIAALITLTSNNVSLTASVLQSILKGGTGGLDVGTSIAADLRVLLNNVAKWTFRQSDSALVSAGGTVTGLPTPVNPSDAAIKSYVDGGSPRSAKAWAMLACGAAGAVTISAAQNVASASYSLTTMTVNFTAALGSGSYAVAGSIYSINSLAQIKPFSLAAGSFSINGYDSTLTGRNWASGDVVSVIVFAN